MIEKARSVLTNTVLLWQPVQYTLPPSPVEAFHDHHGLAVKQANFRPGGVQPKGAAQCQAQPLVPGRIREIRTIGSFSHRRLEDMGSRCRSEWQLPLTVDQEKRRLFLYASDRDAEVVLPAIQAQRVGAQGGQPRGDFIVADRTVFHLCRIAKVRTFWNEAQSADAITTDNGQQIKDASTLGTLARRNFFPDATVIRQQAVEVAGRTPPDQTRSDSGMESEMGNDRSDASQSGS